MTFGYIDFEFAKIFEDNPVKCAEIEKIQAGMPYRTDLAFQDGSHLHYSENLGKAVHD